ncbi:MAG: hypothetical protein Q8K75_10620 [Chlamydiales bacterium]|nr:hypothetical protein [Chlamydiales bacterium]
MESLSSHGPSVVEIHQDIANIKTEIATVRFEATQLLDKTISGLREQMSAPRIVPEGKHFAKASRKYEASVNKQIRGLEKLKNKIEESDIKNAKQAEKLISKVSEQIKKTQIGSVKSDSEDVLELKARLRQLTTHLKTTSDKIGTVASREMTVALPLDRRIKRILSRIAHIKGDPTLPKLERKAAELERLIGKKEAWIAPKESSNQQKMTEATQRMTDLRDSLHTGRELISSWIEAQLQALAPEVEECAYSVEFASSNVDLYQADVSELTNISTILKTGDATNSKLALERRLAGIHVRHEEAVEQLRDTKATIADLKASLPDLEGQGIANLRIQREDQKGIRDVAIQLRKRAEAAVEAGLGDPEELQAELKAAQDLVKINQDMVDELQAQIKAVMPKVAEEAATRIKDLTKDRETLEGKIQSFKSSQDTVMQMIADVGKGKLKQVRKLIEEQKAKTAPRLRDFKLGLEHVKRPMRKQQRLENLQILLERMTSDDFRLPEPSSRNQKDIDAWVKQVDASIKNIKEAFDGIVIDIPLGANPIPPEAGQPQPPDEVDWEDIPL